MEQAWQWWYDKQLRQLDCEASQIRDGLLQQSFVMRRNLELSLLNRKEFSSPIFQEWLTKLENLHSSLQELSDRLSPPYLSEGLPLAIQYLVQKWQTQQPSFQFKLQLPSNWLNKSAARNRIVLTCLEEILQITLARLKANTFTKPGSITQEIQQKVSILITLDKKQEQNQLKIQITYPDSASAIALQQYQEIKYLRQSFMLLTSGQCCYQCQQQMDEWCFRW